MTTHPDPGAQWRPKRKPKPIRGEVLLSPLSHTPLLLREVSHGNCGLLGAVLTRLPPIDEAAEMERM